MGREAGLRLAPTPPGGVVRLEWAPVGSSAGSASTAAKVLPSSERTTLRARTPRLSRPAGSAGGELVCCDLQLRLSPFLFVQRACIAVRSGDVVDGGRRVRLDEPAP